MGFNDLPILAKVFIILSIFFAVTGFLYGLFMKTKKKENNIINNNVKNTRTPSNTTNNTSSRYQSLNLPSNTINQPPKYNHLNQEYFMTTELLSNQQALNISDEPSLPPPNNRLEQQVNSENQTRDHQVIDIPKNIHSPPKYNHHTQEYCMTMEMISNQQSTSHNESIEEINPPPYNNHKPNTH